MSENVDMNFNIFFMEDEIGLYKCKNIKLTVCLV